MRIYLDYAAATPLHPSVKEAMLGYWDVDFYNPSSTYLDAQNVRKSINDARKTVAHWLGAKHGEIIFTAGATESINLAIRGVMEKFPSSNVVISAVEHEAALKSSAKYKRKVAPVDASGKLDLAKLSELIDDKTALVSIIYANNEIGTIQSISQVARVIEKVRSNRRQKGVKQPIYLHTDAVQAANYLDLHVSKLGVDLMTLSAAKIYGPKQVGCLYVKGETELEPLIYGGSQEKSLRGGTENVAGIIGFAKALNLVQTDRHEEAKRVSELRNQLMKTLLVSIDGAQVAGTMKKRLPNNLNVYFPGVDGERLVMKLDERGVMVATGAACEASNDEPSHVLKALRQSNEKAHSSLRISLGRDTNAGEIKKAGKTIVDVAGSLRQN